MSTKPEKHKYNGIGTEAVKAKTGKGWDEWLKILKKGNADRLSHKDIAALLHKKFKLEGWWAQMVTVGFEQANKLRVKNERPGGEFSVDVSKVFTYPVTDLYRSFTDEEERRKWVDENFELRKATENKGLRANFKKATANLAVLFYDKGKGKSHVVITESKLASARQVEQCRKFWKDAIENLESLLKKKPGA